MSHGKICYLEIPAKTGEASAAFYGSIFGWKIRKRGDGETAFDDPNGVLAGLLSNDRACRSAFVAAHLERQHDQIVVTRRRGA